MEMTRNYEISIGSYGKQKNRKEMNLYGFVLYSTLFKHLNS